MAAVRRGHGLAVILSKALMLAADTESPIRSSSDRFGGLDAQTGIYCTPYWA